MPRSTPIAKLCRREGISPLALGNYTGSKKKAVQKKNYPPGIHGPKGNFSKPKEYGKQLREKQKAKRIFNVTEKQFRNYYKKAEQQKGNTGDNLMKLLEMRVDNILYRAGIAVSRRQSRQIVSHGLVQLNGKKINIPSIKLKAGDKFDIREKSKKSPLFGETAASRHKAPRWLKSDLKNLSGEVIAEPTNEDFEKNIDSQPVVEFYSK